MTERQREIAEKRGSDTGLVPNRSKKNRSAQLLRRETICCLTFSPQDVKFIFIMAPPACHHNYSCTTHDCVSLSDRLSGRVSRSRLVCDFLNLRVFSHSAAALKGLPRCFVCFCSLYVY